MTTGTGSGTEGVDPYRRLLGGVSVGLALLEGAGRVQLANAAAERMLGYGAGELVGRSLEDFYSLEDRAEGRAARALATAVGEGRHDEEGWCVRRDGARVRACFVIVSLPGGFTLEVHPSRPQIEEQLRERLAREEEGRERAEKASQARDEFLATLSHELRTPLTAIMGWAHLLRSGHLDDASRVRALETIERNAHLEAQLTADILDVARIITGKMRLQIESVDPRAITEAAVETVRQNAHAKGVELAVTAQGETGPVPADPDRLQQVVANLLTNAIKFTPAGGRVEVQLGMGESEVIIRVIDTGDGISPEMLPRVFEKYRQEGSRARAKGGLGLGLAIVHHIVELHSGRVSAASEGPGRGSTFTVRLPILAGRSTPAVAPSAVARNEAPTR